MRGKTLGFSYLLGLNPIKKEKKLTAKAKALHSTARSAVRADPDPDKLGRIVELEEARDAELAAILLTECNLQLPTMRRWAPR